MSTHSHDHRHDEDQPEVNVEEQMKIARDLATELGDIFVQLIQGQIDFAEVSFATYDVLSDLHAVSTGHYEVIAQDDEDEDDDDEDWDEDDAAAEQEELSGEPSR
ncbi:MAG: hypothetical protein ACR2J8_02300 [Thermomicrobiales bacterium]